MTEILKLRDSSHPPPVLKLLSNGSRSVIPAALVMVWFMFVSLGYAAGSALPFAVGADWVGALSAALLEDALVDAKASTGGRGSSSVVMASDGYCRRRRSMRAVVWEVAGRIVVTVPCAGISMHGRPKTLMGLQPLLVMVSLSFSMLSLAPVDQAPVLGTIFRVVRYSRPSNG